MSKSLQTLGSIQAFSDTVESEGQQMKQCSMKYLKKFIKIRILKFHEKTTFIAVFIPDGSGEAVHLYPIDEVEERGALLPG
jgi:hypothetical protein